MSLIKKKPFTKITFEKVNSPCSSNTVDFTSYPASVRTFITAGINWAISLNVAILISSQNVALTNTTNAAKIEQNERRRTQSVLLTHAF